MNPNPTYRYAALRSQSGFTLVELLVAVVIGLALTLALTTITIRSEIGKRVLSSGNDMSQNTSFITYELDRDLRSAGSGFAQSWTLTAGCPLNVSQNGAQILPRLTPFPAPFATVPTAVAMAPVLIHAGAGTGGSDVLAIMTGAAGLSEAQIRIAPKSATTNSVLVDNTIGTRGDDLVLFMQAAGCMVQQVAAPFTGGATPQLNFAGAYAAPTVNGLALNTFGAGSAVDFMLSLGNVTGNRPMFQLIGIGPNATLVSYDLLRLDGTDATPALAEGVVDMRAIYGIDADDDLPLHTVDTWVAPTAAGFTVAALTARPPLVPRDLQSIKAVRIGLILRSDRIEKELVSPASLTLFGTVPGIVPYVRTLSTDEQHQRFRTVEFTVPLRNVITVP